MTLLLVCKVVGLLAFGLILVGLALGIWGRLTAESDPWRSTDRSMLSIFCSLVGLMIVLLSCYIHIMETKFIMRKEALKQMQQNTQGEQK